MLSDFLALNVFNFILIMARMSPVFILFPGISAGYVPMRIRLLLALMVAFISLPIVQSSLPPQPETPGDLTKLLVSEVFIGVFIGTIIQMFMSALTIAGHEISRSSGLMNAMVDDVVSDEQGEIMIAWLNLVALTLIFITGIHELMLMAIVDSYNLFIPGAAILTGDFLSVVTSSFNDAFYIGVRLTAPFLVFALVFQITAGILARLSPQMNVFFVALPAQVLIGLSILMIAMPAMMLVFLGFMEDGLYGLLNPGAGGG